MTERDRRDLKAASEALRAIQQDIRAIRTQQERGEQERAIKPVWVDPVLAAHQQAETNRTTNDDRQYRIQNSLRWATWAAFVAATVYAGIAYWQRDTMDKTFVEVKKQTAAAASGAQSSQESARLTRQQLIGTQSAILNAQIDYVTLGDMAGNLTVNLQNQGHVNATNVSLTINASEATLPSVNRVGQTEKFSPSVPPIAPSIPYSYTVKVWIPRLAHRPETLNLRQPHFWPSDWPGTHTYVFDGEFGYDPGFDAPPARETFCKAWTPPYDYQSHSGQTASDSGNLADCKQLPLDIQNRLKDKQEAESTAHRGN